MQVTLPTIGSHGLTPKTLTHRRPALLQWLTQDALPTWVQAGVDHRCGGFFEQIDLRGEPVEAPRRTRVVARQIYVFATAGRRGWLAAPQADALVDHGLNFLLQKLRLPDGTFAASVTADGALVDARFDLYEHAFVLFAWAAACRQRPADPACQALRAQALELLLTLRRHWQHPEAGFEESTPRTLPLRSNPHMHLLEAALEWAEVSTGPARTRWVALADELAGLCLRRFVDPVSGALREHFDGDWRPMPGAAGRLVEPGHQFEWAWLLMRWAALADRPQAHAVARRLLAIGEQHGVDRARGVAVNALDDALHVTDGAAKLWPQTERVKAWHLAGAETIGRADPGEARHANERLAASVDGLSRYLLETPVGLWQEQMGADGRFVAQACRASSLYHIVCAIDTLHAEPARAAPAE